jgi:chromosome segregation ATPase
MSLRLQMTIMLDLNSAHNNLSGDLRGETDNNHRMRDDLAAVEDAIKRNELDHANHVNNIRDLENHNDTSRANQDDLNRKIDDIEHQIRDITANLNVLDGQLKGLQTDLDHLNANADDLGNKLNAETDNSNNL